MRRAHLRKLAFLCCKLWPLASCDLWMRKRYLFLQSDESWSVPALWFKTWCISRKRWAMKSASYVIENSAGDERRIDHPQGLPVTKSNRPSQIVPRTMFCVGTDHEIGFALRFHTCYFSIQSSHILAYDTSLCASECLRNRFCFEISYGLGFFSIITYFGVQYQ